MESKTETLADDRLVGAEAIAEFRGEQVRRTRYLLERGDIPHGREGNLFVASKRVLREHWARTVGSAPNPRDERG
jgi:hypothetical protein